MWAMISPRGISAPFETGSEQRGIALMIRNKPLRRSLGALLVLLGALLIWLPYDFASGIVLVLAGAVLELVGITLEKNDKQA
jgi:drug/metabolite transporter (DMT)-like permease